MTLLFVLVVFGPPLVILAVGLWLTYRGPINVVHGFRLPPPDDDGWYSSSTTLPTVLHNGPVSFLCDDSLSLWLGAQQLLGERSRRYKRAVLRAYAQRQLDEAERASVARLLAGESDGKDR